jgi:hypothetical protein
MDEDSGHNWRWRTITDALLWEKARGVGTGEGKGDWGVGKIPLILELHLRWMNPELGNVHEAANFIFLSHSILEFPYRF